MNYFDDDEPTQEIPPVLTSTLLGEFPERNVDVYFDDDEPTKEIPIQTVYDLTGMATCGDSRRTRDLRVAYGNTKK